MIDKPPPKMHLGVLRPLFRLFDDSAVLQVEWLDVETNKIVWTETIRPKAGMRAISQIVCSGEFQPMPGYFLDDDGRRHFVMHAEPGQLGTVFGKGS